MLTSKPHLSIHVLASIGLAAYSLYVFLSLSTYLSMYPKLVRRQRPKSIGKQHMCTACARHCKMHGLQGLQRHVGIFGLLEVYLAATWLQPGCNLAGVKVPDISWKSILRPSVLAGVIFRTKSSFPATPRTAFPVNLFLLLRRLLYFFFCV